jgi:signal transduction histidine kinase
MLLDKRKQLQNLIRKEVADKSMAPAIFYTLYSAIVFFYQFNAQRFILPLQIAAVFVILMAITRIVISKKVLQEKEVSDNSWFKLCCTIWSTTAAWAFIFTLATLENRDRSDHYLVMIILIMGFLPASIRSLSYSRGLFFPFQFAVLGPPLIVSLYDYIHLGEKSYGVHALLFSLYLLYMFKQYKEVRGDLFQRLNYQLDLEESLIALELSQQELIEKTSNLMQTSKLAGLAEMACGLSHEVNNSLMVILASIQHIERRLKKEFREISDINRRVEMCKEAINRVKTVIHGLYCFSQEMGFGPKENIPLEEVLTRSLNYCQEMIKVHSIKLTVPDIPLVSLYCHPFQISQAIFNVLKNADDALKPLQDENEKWIKLSFSISHSNVLFIKITNGGPPITQEVKEKLFQPFFTTKEVGQGTGLSLSVAKGIVSEHGGDIYLDQNTEHTTFVFKLPLA